MDIEYQMLFNFIIGAFGAVVGWVMNNMWNVITHLQDRHDHTDEKIAAVDRLVAGEYVTRGEFSTVISKLFDKLDKLTDELHERNVRDRRGPNV